MFAAVKAQPGLAPLCAEDGFSRPEPSMDAFIAGASQGKVRTYVFFV